MNRLYPWLIFSFVLFSGITGHHPAATAEQAVVDAAGRQVVLPDTIKRLICSGPGCLRLITYLQAQDRVVAVDDIETRRSNFDARPYALANPDFRQLPVFGAFRGQDDPEKILGLQNPPQVIFKTYASMGHDPSELEHKTRIPVVVLEYGNLGDGRQTFYHTLTLLGQILNKTERAEQLINFFNREIHALAWRTQAIDPMKTCFIGGVALKGPHGFQSTEPSYPPFAFVRAAHIAQTGSWTGTRLQHSLFSKEKMLQADPDVLFLDLSTLQMGEHRNGMTELHTDPVYQALTAVKTQKVYGVLPYNWYSQNFGSILANSWYIGKTLYPEQFSDIDPAAKADDIYAFLLSEPLFDRMNALFHNLAFTPVLQP